MDIYKRLLKALGVKPTPAALEAAARNLSAGEAAFMVDAADRFGELFGGRSLAGQADLVRAAAALAERVEDQARTAAAIKRQLDSRCRLTWSRTVVTDCGEGVWAWPGVEGEGEA